MKMKIYFVRHGRTEWNKQGRMQGREDIPLCPEGIEDARATRNLLKDEVFDKVIVSPLMRARQTAEIINEYHNAPIVVEPRLIERDFGELEGVSKTSFNFQDLFSLTKVTRYKDAEPIEDFYKRIQECINEFKGKEGTILIVAHGGVCVPIKMMVEHLDDNIATNSLIPHNGEVYTFEI